MEVERREHSISKSIDQQRQLDKHNPDGCEMCETAFQINSVHFIKDLSIQMEIGHTVYDSCIKKGSIVNKTKQVYPEHYFNFLPIPYKDTELSFYTVLNNRCTYTLVLQENDLCRKVFTFKNYEASSNPFYSERHRSIFQIVRLYDQETLSLIRIELGKSLFDITITVVPVSAKYEINGAMRVCAVPRQERIILMNNTRLDFIEFSGQIVKTVDVNRYRFMKTFDICCTQKTVIIVCRHVYCSRELTVYIAMFYDLETLSYTGEYEIDFESEYHCKYYKNNTALTYSSSHDVALLCSIEPDEFILFSDKIMD